MFAPGVIILEKQPLWEAELKRAFAGDLVQVRACRLPGQVPGVLSNMPGSVLVLDLESGPAECLRLIAKGMEVTPPIQIVVLATTELADLELPARELGAVEFLHAPLGGIRLAELCRRLLRGHASKNSAAHFNSGTRAESVIA